MESVNKIQFEPIEKEKIAELKFPEEDVLHNEEKKNRDGRTWNEPQHWEILIRLNLKFILLMINLTSIPKLLSGD